MMLWRLLSKIILFIFGESWGTKILHNMITKSVSQHNFERMKSLIEANGFDVEEIKIDFEGFPDEDEECHLLHLAIISNNFPAVQYCIENKFNVNLRSFCMLSPIGVASMWKRYNIAEYILNSGATPRTFDMVRNSPLSFAIINFDVPMVNLLLKHGFDVSEKNDNGISPLMLLIEGSLHNKGIEGILRNLVKSKTIPFEDYVRGLRDFRDNQRKDPTGEGMWKTI